MTIYILLYLIFLIPAIGLTSFKKTNKATYYLLLFAFAVSLGVRDLIGGYDVYIYRAVYIGGPETIDNSGFEWGVRQMFSFLYLFSASEYFMFFVTAVVTVLATFTSLKKYSVFLYLALFIFFCKFYLMSYVYLRQGIAMGIIWYSLRYVESRKFFPFLLVVFLAFLFHRSAFIFLPIYFMREKYDIRLYIGVTVVFFSFLVLPVFDPLLTLVSSFSERYEAYGQHIGENFNVLYVIEALLCFIVLLLQYKKKMTFREIIIYNGMFIYIILQLLAAKKGIFIRTTWYYLIFYCVFLSDFIQTSRFNRRVFKPILILIFSTLFFRMLIIWDNGDFLPYKSFFDNTERNSIWQHYKR